MEVYVITVHKHTHNIILRFDAVNPQCCVFLLPKLISDQRSCHWRLQTYSIHALCQLTSSFTCNKLDSLKWWWQLKVFLNYLTLHSHIKTIYVITSRIYIHKAKASSANWNTSKPSHYHCQLEICQSQLCKVIEQ